MCQQCSELYKVLIDTDFSCIPTGIFELCMIRRIIANKYDHLCNGDCRCAHQKIDEPEWFHRVRLVLQRKITDPNSRVSKVNPGKRDGLYRFD
jgi:hypothetical protein